MASGLAPRWAAKQPHQSVVNPTGDKPPHHSKPAPTLCLHFNLKIVIYLASKIILQIP
jgi:hypothetical protein